MPGERTDLRSDEHAVLPYADQKRASVASCDDLVRGIPVDDCEAPGTCSRVYVCVRVCVCVCMCLSMHACGRGFGLHTLVHDMIQKSEGIAEVSHTKYKHA